MGGLRGEGRGALGGLRDGGSGGRFLEKRSDALLHVRVAVGEAGWRAWEENSGFTGPEGCGSERSVTAAVSGLIVEVGKEPATICVGSSMVYASFIFGGKI